jgi:hypothetical protein
MPETMAKSSGIRYFVDDDMPCFSAATRISGSRDAEMMVAAGPVMKYVAAGKKKGRTAGMMFSAIPPVINIFISTSNLQASQRPVFIQRRQSLLKTGYYGLWLKSFKIKIRWYNKKAEY